MSHKRAMMNKAKKSEMSEKKEMARAKKHEPKEMHIGKLNRRVGRKK